MYQVIIIFHVLFGLAIIGLVLMQQGRGADAGAAFGSGSSGSVFGAQGSASFLSTATAIFAALFFISSLTLTILSSDGGIIRDLFAEEDAAQVSELPSADEVVDSVPTVTDVPVVPDDAIDADTAADVVVLPGNENVPVEEAIITETEEVEAAITEEAAAVETVITESTAETEAN